MRAIAVGVFVFACGLAAAALVASPRAGARAADGSISGSVGPGFSISMSESSVTPGNYTINVTDSSSMHNFHFSGPGVNKSTSIGGTGSTSWSVTLVDGTYSFQCDAHAATMNGSLTVADPVTTTTDATTTTTTTTATTTTAPTTSTSHTTTEHTTTQATTTADTTTAATTTAVTTTAAATTSEGTTTASTPTTTRQTTTAKPLKARVTKAHATGKTVSVTVTSNEHGHAVADLFKGSRRFAHAAGPVPGKLVLHAAKTLEPGSYTLRLRVTAGKKTTTTSRVVTVA